MASGEIANFCEKNLWLNDIKKFVTNWNRRLFDEWKKNGSIQIEKQLNEIRNWSENIRDNLPKTLITQNKILKIQTNPIENYLLPKLDTIYNEICEILVIEINKDTSILIQGIQKIIDVIFLIDEYC